MLFLLWGGTNLGWIKAQPLAKASSGPGPGGGGRETERERERENDSIVFMFIQHKGNIHNTNMVKLLRL